MEEDLNPCDLYEGATKDYMIHVFNLVEVENQPWLRTSQPW